MKIFRNEKGFALITALMITMICLVISLGILSVVIQNTRSGGIKKSYQNTVEAAYGAAELQMFEVMPKLLADIFANETNATQIDAVELRRGVLTLGTAFGNPLSTLAFSKDSACLVAKLSSAPGNWIAAGCPALDLNIDPRTSPDFTLTLPGLQGQNFTVQSKIVDTSVGVPYMPSPPGPPMQGGGTGGSGGNGTNTLVSHFVYRVEVSASRTTNPMERGAVSVLYEF